MAGDSRRRKASALTAVLCIVGTVLVAMPTADISYALAGLAVFGLAGGLTVYILLSGRKGGRR